MDSLLHGCRYADMLSMASAPQHPYVSTAMGIHDQPNPKHLASLENRVWRRRHLVQGKMAFIKERGVSEFQ